MTHFTMLVYDPEWLTSWPWQGSLDRTCTSDKEGCEFPPFGSGIKGAKAFNPTVYPLMLPLG